MTPSVGQTPPDADRIQMSLSLEHLSSDTKAILEEDEEEEEMTETLATAIAPPTKPPRLMTPTPSFTNSSEDVSRAADILSDDSDSDDKTMTLKPTAATRTSIIAKTTAENNSTDTNNHSAAAAAENNPNGRLFTRNREKKAEEKRRRQAQVPEGQAPVQANPNPSESDNESVDSSTSTSSGSLSDTSDNASVGGSSGAAALINRNPLAKKKPTNNATTLSNPRALGARPKDNSSSSAINQNPMAMKKKTIDEEKPPVNQTHPLKTRSSSDSLLKGSVGSLDSPSTLNNLPNFRMAHVAKVNVHGASGVAAKPAAKKKTMYVVGADGSTVEQVVADEPPPPPPEMINNALPESEEDGDLLEDDELGLFSLEPIAQAAAELQVKSQPSKRQLTEEQFKMVKQRYLKRLAAQKKYENEKKKSGSVSHSNDAPLVGGLTAQEEARLEEAKKAAEEKIRREEEARKVKSRKAIEEREIKNNELKQKLEISKHIQIKQDNRAKAKKAAAAASDEDNNSKTETKTESLRQQLNAQLFYEHEPERPRAQMNTVTLDIDDDDDLLPIRRRNGDQSSSSSSSSEDEDEKATERRRHLTTPAPRTSSEGAALTKYSNSRGLVQHGRQMINYSTGMCILVQDLTGCASVVVVTYLPPCPPLFCNQMPKFVCCSIFISSMLGICMFYINVTVQLFTSNIFMV